MAGLTREGLEIKTQDEVLNDNRIRASNLFADLVPAGDIVDVGANGTIGRLIGVVSPAEASMWEAIQQVYNSFNPATAIGIALDNVIALSGISRLVAQPTRAQVILEGTTNIAISSPLGKAYSSTTQRVFSILNPVILSPMSASGIGIVPITVADSTNYTFSYSLDGVNYIDTVYNSGIGATSSSILAGLKTNVDLILGGVFTTYYQDGRLFITRTDPFQVADFTVSVNLRIEKVRKLGIAVDDIVGAFPQQAMSIDTISVPIPGWDSILNPISATTGRLVETDEELRERFRNSKFFQSQNILEALLDALRNVDGVSDVVVYENDTDAPDVNGVPGHSFLPIVLGGLPSDIGNTIWQNKPTGIPSVGDTTVQIADSQGFLHNISYKRPTEIPIYITVSISNAGGLAGDAQAQIRQNIENYGESNYFIGDDVIYSRFYTPINSVPGHMVNSLFIGTSPSPTDTANIEIDFDAVATFNPANIIVNLV
jgi:uncharacterized phage protein gp47/JayE